MKTQVYLPLLLMILPFWLLGQNPEWMVFNSSNSGLTDNDLRALSIDNNGVKWIGSVNDALFSYDGSAWNHYNSANSFVFDDYILCISTDSQNNKWIGTRSGGMSEFDDALWYFWDETHSGIPDDKVYDIQFEGDYCWIATMHGLARFNRYTDWIVYNTSNSDLPAEEVRAISIDGQGNKWLATWGGGIVKFDGTNWTPYNTSNSSIPTDYCISLYYDGQYFWVGTSLGGLVRFDGINWTIYTEQNSGLPSNSVFSTKKEGSKLWFATGGGLAMLNDTTWTVYNPSNSGLPGQYAKDIEIDAYGNKWIATDQGLAEFRQGGVLGAPDPGKAVNDDRDLTITPNPVATKTTISWECSSSDEANFQLLNPAGQIIFLKTEPANVQGMATFTLDLSDQPAGILFLKCLINNHLTIKKIVVN
jgi:ligand-binding sensor domain-containing protein